MTGLHPDVVAWYGKAKVTGQCRTHGTVLYDDVPCPDCSELERQAEPSPPVAIIDEAVLVHPDQMGLFDTGEGEP